MQQGSQICRVSTSLFKGSQLLYESMRAEHTI